MLNAKPFLIDHKIQAKLVAARKVVYVGTI